MRVLYVFEGKLKGHGLDLVARQQLEALSAAGHQTDLISRGHSSLPGVRSHRLWFNPAKFLSWAPATYYYGATQRVIATKALRQLLQHRSDMVIGWTRCSFRVFEAAKALEVKTILNTGSAAIPTPEDMARNPRRWPAIPLEIVRQEYELCDLILAPSTAAAERYATSGLPPRKIIPLERGFSTEFYPPKTPPDKFRLLFCGRICERKGARQVLDAWKAAALPEAELWFVGDLDGELRPLFENLDVPGVKVLGFQKNVAEIMRQCSAQILLSRNESFGKSLLEGAACGLASIVTPNVGFQVEEGATGFVVGRDDRAQIVERIRFLHANRAACQAMGEAARARVAEQFTWDQFRRRFLAAVEEAVW